MATETRTMRLDADGNIRWKHNNRLVKRDFIKKFEKALRSAENWSMDEENIYGEAVVTQMGENFIVSADVSYGVEILAHFINGDRFK